MGISRSTFYDAPDTGASDVAVVAEMKVICANSKPMATGVWAPNCAIVGWS